MTTRTPSDTDRYEELNARVTAMRNLAWDLKTVARSYSALASQISDLPTQGDLWDKAREAIVNHAIESGNKAAQHSDINFANALKLEEQGIRPIS